MKKLLQKLILAATTAASVTLAISTTATLASSPNVSAPIAVVMCFETGDILYDRNMTQRWVPSSMTKIMTAFITYQEIYAGNLSLDTNVRISQTVATFSQNRRIEGSFVPLNANANITVENLLRLTMLPSSNGAAMALAEHISGTEAAFVERMNQTAYDLGMYASFANSHGAQAHHSNAYSIAVLIRAFIQQYPDILRITSMRTASVNGTNHSNTNRLVAPGNHYFAGADGFKTGVTRASGWGHSTTAYRDGRRVIAVLMNTTSNDNRQSQSRTLLQFGFDELERRALYAADNARVYHNGAQTPLASRPQIHDGNLLLPAGDMLRAFGLSPSWDSGTRTVITWNNNGLASSITVGTRSAAANGMSIRLITAPRIFNNRIYAPLDFFEAVTGTTAIWCRNTGRVDFRLYD